MRAGKLDQTITLQRFTHTVSAWGEPIEDWTDVATVKAELVTDTAKEYLAAYGAREEAVRVFRCRFKGELTTKDAVVHDGLRLNIRELVPIPRRRGVEIRCEEPRT